MPHRPLSFTKNLGGLEQLYDAIQTAYRPGTTLREFEGRLPRRLENRRLVIVEFFLATRVIGRTEYVAEDTLIRTTLAEPYGPTLARLYLFAMLLNLPGQRLRQTYRSTAPAQNEYARIKLHDGLGWIATGIDVDQSILPWVRANVSGGGGLRKFATNLAYFFEQAQFDVDPAGHLVTYGNHWGPLALQLFFDRYLIHHPAADPDELVSAAREHEVHRLLGLDSRWLDSVIDGAATTYLSPNRFLLCATQESLEERATAPSSPAGRRTAEVSRLIRSTSNKLEIEQWYRRTCQICGRQILGRQGNPIIDYGHIRPLGEPHNGPDNVKNMLSLCPNHHRQLDHGGIGIEAGTLRIIAPHGSAPTPLASVQCEPGHALSADCLRYHMSRIFSQ